MDRDGLSYPEVAARVRAAGAPKTKWQSIHQLVTGGVSQPKYEVELARAFGLSVEDLRAGRIDKHPLNEGAENPQNLRGPWPVNTSQSVGLDRVLLRQAVVLLRRFELSQDQLLSPEEFAERLADLYQVLPRAPETVSEPEGAGK